MDEDMKGSDKDKKIGKGTGIALAGIQIAVAGVVAGAIAMKQPELQISSKYENPIRFGLRALKWGTLISLSGAGLLGGAVCWYLDVWSIPEFRTRMIQIMSPISRSIASRFPKAPLKHAFKPQSQDTQCNSDEDGND